MADPLFADDDDDLYGFDDPKPKAAKKEASLFDTLDETDDFLGDAASKKDTKANDAAKPKTKASLFDDDDDEDDLFSKPTKKADAPSSTKAAAPKAEKAAKAEKKETPSKKAEPARDRSGSLTKEKKARRSSPRLAKKGSTGSHSKSPLTKRKVVKSEKKSVTANTVPLPVDIDGSPDEISHIANKSYDESATYEERAAARAARRKLSIKDKSRTGAAAKKAARENGSTTPKSTPKGETPKSKSKVARPTPSKDEHKGKKKTIGRASPAAKRKVLSTTSKPPKGKEGKPEKADKAVKADKEPKTEEAAKEPQHPAVVPAEIDELKRARSEAEVRVAELEQAEGEFLRQIDQATEQAEEFKQEAERQETLAERASKRAEKAEKRASVLEDQLKETAAAATAPGAVPSATQSDPETEAKLAAVETELTSTKEQLADALAQIKALKAELAEAKAAVRSKPAPAAKKPSLSRQSSSADKPKPAQKKPSNVDVTKPASKPEPKPEPAEQPEPSISITDHKEAAEETPVSMRQKNLPKRSSVEKLASRRSVQGIIGNFDKKLDGPVAGDESSTDSLSPTQQRKRMEFKPKSAQQNEPDEEPKVLFRKPSDVRKSQNRASFRMSDAGEKCALCNKTVYLVEKLVADNIVYHKACFKCEHCKRSLGVGTYAALQGKIYCKPHFKQLFKLKGNYDEGFGGEQHKKKWLNQDDADSEA